MILGPHIPRVFKEYDEMLRTQLHRLSHILQCAVMGGDKGKLSKTSKIKIITFSPGPKGRIRPA